ncbi:flavin reductase family protein [Specibacter sp. NPDC057265]|uniref:flavin reductase family protein n=1 Tax=Specibacter sp. NPDC057265 TaxID=3346075 RepID=UPI0036256F34
MELHDPMDIYRVFPQLPSAEQIQEYRRLSAEQAGGVGVVSTRVNNRDYTATVSSFLSVSYDPPTLLLSLYTESRIAQAIMQSGTWALSLLSTHQKAQANWLASPGTPLEGLLNQIDFRRGPATGNVVLAGCLAFFEAETSAIHEAATHSLVVGSVVAMGEDIEPAQLASPLVHYGQEYRRLSR